MRPQHLRTRPRLVLAILVALAQLWIVPTTGAHEEVCVEGEQTFNAACLIDADTGAWADGSVIGFGDPVGPAVSTFTYSANMTPVGYIARNIPTSGTGSNYYNSDLAFWGDYAYQGHYNGFRIIDIADPENPTLLADVNGCGTSTGQGDLVVYENLVIRAWDAPSTQNCGGVSAGSNFEGLNFFDVSNKSAPVHLGNLRMASGSSPAQCGAHTLTLAGRSGDNLYLYVGASATGCPGLDIVRIPLNNPTAAAFVRREPSGRACHDNTVILGTVNRVVCAGGNGFTLWSIDPTLPPSASGGFEDPIQIRSTSISGVSIGHSSAVTYDGKYMVFGHEPGGGSAANCQAGSGTVNRSLFFYDVATGASAGTFVQPRPQTAQENCTWHNFNFIPTNRGYVLVVGSYQMGITIIDMTNPAAAQQIAFADPARLTTSGILLGGDWSTYWYNGYIYESDIRRGLIIWKLDDRLGRGDKVLSGLNPQTNAATFDLDTTAPTTTASLSPAPVNGWYATDPTVTLTAVETGVETSGIDVTEYNLDGAGWTAYAGPFTVSGEGSHSLLYRSTDFALNVETTRSLSFEVDTIGPDVTISSPEVATTQAAGAPGNYALGSVVNAAYGCSDATSGMAGCEPSSASPIDTSTVGFHTYTVTGTDAAGHVTTVTHQYNVYWPGWTNFHQPIDPGVVNVAKAGSAIPVKFGLGGDMGLGIFAAGFPASRQVACDTNAPSATVEETVNAGGSSLSYGGNGYVYVWKTQASWVGTCRELTVKLADNTTHSEIFRFK